MPAEKEEDLILPNKQKDKIPEEETELFAYLVWAEATAEALANELDIAASLLSKRDFRELKNFLVTVNTSKEYPDRQSRASRSGSPKTNSRYLVKRT